MQHILTPADIDYIQREVHSVQLAGGTCANSQSPKKLYYVFSLITHVWYEVIIWPANVQKFDTLEQAIEYYNSL